VVEITVFGGFMTRLLSAALAAAALIIGGASAASAQSLNGVERSGNTFHARACPKINVAGVAACHAHVVTDARGNIQTNQRNVTSNALPQGYGPADLQAAYKVTTSGSGSVTVAIVDAYGYGKAESDLAVYRSTYGLPACTTANGCFMKVGENGGPAPTRNNTGWDQEQALDLDMVSSMCPNCHILLVEANSASFGDLGAAVNYAAAHALVVSNSYGGNESPSETSYDSMWYNHPGVAVIASSGDSGYGVEYPAASPYVVAAGGTSLMRASNSRGWSETVWSGAGSGCSAIEPKPTWQHDNLCGFRTVADVSAIADPNTGVAVYGPPCRNCSAWMVFGGTSVASPIIGGLYGNNGGAVVAGSPYSHTSSLNDVTSGSNGSCGNTYLCTGEVGYDGPTGLGTPIGTSPF
jgi:subtilase family serine protease